VTSVLALGCLAVTALASVETSEGEVDGGLVPAPTAAELLTPDAGLALPAAPFASLSVDGGVGSEKVIDLWPREMPAAGAWDVVATGALGVGTIVLQFTYTPQSIPNWSGGVLFDDWVRRGLRLSSESARAGAATISNYLLYALVAVPFVDAWLSAGLVQKRPDVALRLTLLDAQALLATTFITLAGQHLILRARPFTTLCVHEPNATECTDGSAQNTSFPSGHSSIAFTVAMLECVNHAHMDTDRSGWSGAACPVTLVAAGVTGLLRIVSDRHYTTDVIIGGLIGAGIGYLVPTLHFAIAASDSTTLITPVVAPNYLGLALTGGF